MTALSVGDLAFYRSHGSLFDKLIELRTGDGDHDTDDTLTHVEVIVAVDPDGSVAESAESIGALSEGIVRHALPAGAIIVPTGARCLPERLPAMLAWLTAQVGAAYGGNDIASQLLTWLDPHGPYLSEPGRYDCSHLAAVALVGAGFPLPIEQIAALGLVTPASLYRAVTAVLAASSPTPAAHAAVNNTPPR